MSSDETPAFRNSTTIERFGRQWRLDFESDPQDLVESRIVGLRPTLVVGLIASLLLFLMTLTLVHTQAHAEQLAARMSESFRRSQLRFRSAMQYSAIGMGLLDHDDHIVDANPSLAIDSGQQPRIADRERRSRHTSSTVWSRGSWVGSAIRKMACCVQRARCFAATASARST